jgi:hypothetical protein
MKWLRRTDIKRNVSGFQSWGIVPSIMKNPHIMFNQLRFDLFTFTLFTWRIKIVMRSNDEKSHVSPNLSHPSMFKNNISKTSKFLRKFYMFKHCQTTWPRPPSFFFSSLYSAVKSAKNFTSLNKSKDRKFWIVLLPSCYKQNYFWQFNKTIKYLPRTNQWTHYTLALYMPMAGQAVQLLP